MAQLDTGALQTAFNDFRSRKITSEQFEAVVQTLYQEAGYSEAQAAQLMRDYERYARTGQSANAPTLSPFDNPLQPEERQPIYGGVEGGGGSFGEGSNVMEVATDPWTGYLNRLGIGGKVNYNPAERYQASLFQPLQNMYDISEVQARAGMGPQKYTTLSDYLTGAGMPTAGTGAKGMTPLFGQAAGLLKNLFGATPEQQGFFGYEPGSSIPEGGTEAVYDPGNIAQLQQLMKYGLRETGGAAGSQFVANMLPKLQQAYYGQKVGVGTGGVTNFLDWARQKYPSMFS